MQAPAGIFLRKMPAAMDGLLADTPVGLPSLEAEFAARAPMERRKRLGQFFTPEPIARAMVAWCWGRETRSLLDPAVGPGIFPACALDLPARERPHRIAGYDIDPNAMSMARDRLNRGTSCELDLRLADFLTAPLSERFDAIVCNPPYIRHHDASVPAEVYTELEGRFGVRLSRATNVYALFLLRIASLLSERGRAAVITPAEFLNADFGVAVKQALLASGLLRGFVIFDHASSVFEGILTTAAITLLDARAAGSRTVRRVHVDSVEELDGVLRSVGADDEQTDSLIIPASREALDPKDKWANTEDVQEVASSSSMPLRPFSDFAVCSRGIATGANDFFTLTRREAAQWELPDSALKPCVTKAAQVRESCWTDACMSALIKADKKALLFDGVAFGEHPAVQRYIAHGETRGLHLRYLTRHRNPWYAVERRPPADIWVATFGRGRLRFVLNNSGALSLTAFHAIYLRPPFRPFAKHLLAFLQSDAGLAACRRQHRVYGDGLLKFEPRDVERLLVPDFEALSAAALAEIEDAADGMLAIDGAEPSPNLSARLRLLFS